jgi:hypothetical protein
MDKVHRARTIIDHVMSLDDRWGRAGPPRSANTNKPSRLISDDCRWEARVTRGDQKGPDGELWDLIELSVYGQPRMTALFRGEDVELRMFLSGVWEPIFTIVGSSDPTELRPY